MIEQLHQEISLRDRARTSGTSVRHTRPALGPPHRRRHAVAQGFRRIADALDS